MAVKKTNPFLENEKRLSEIRETESKATNKDSESKDKYKVLLRLDSSLEAPIRRAAKEVGLPVTKYIELAVRKELREGGLL